MSSEISTEPQPRESALPPSRTGVRDGDPGFEPWQLFTLAGLIGATIAVFMARGESPSAVILISLTIFAAAAVGIAALGTVLPLMQKTTAPGAQVLGGRTRAALEREKTLALRSIKELEFDQAMGKVSEKDFAEMSARLRARAARLMRQLDAGVGYRDQIEREVAKRIGAAPQQPPEGKAEPAEVVAPSMPAAFCTSCGAPRGAADRFCSQCGTSLRSV
jgi:hypothetical protein